MFLLPSCDNLLTCSRLFHDDASVLHTCCKTSVTLLAQGYFLAFLYISDQLSLCTESTMHKHWQGLDLDWRRMGEKNGGKGR